MGEFPKTPPEQVVLRLVEQGEFSIDEMGRVWRLRSRGKRLAEPRRAERRSGGGYLQVRRMVDTKRYHALAHRVVWAFYNGPIPVGMQVNHLNGLKDDNRPENLQICTPSENMKHAHRHRLRDQRGERNPAAKLTDREVAQIRLAYADGGFTQQELADRFGVSFQTVSKIVRGDRREAQGGPTRDYTSRRNHGRVTRDDASGRFVALDFPEVSP